MHSTALWIDEVLAGVVAAMLIPEHGAPERNLRGGSARARDPDPMPGEESEIEIRPLFEAEDFGKEFTPELRGREERLRAEIERQRRVCVVGGAEGAGSLKGRSKIYTHFWYAREAEEAATFYASIFPDSYWERAGTESRRGTCS